MFRFLGNLIWFFIYGIWMAAIHFVLGIAFCVTLIFIPTGLQFLKIASYAIWPFGRKAAVDFDLYPKCNLLWVIFFGWWLAILHTVVGIVLCFTIVGIPFAKKCFKLSSLSFTPYGAMVV